MTKILHSSPSKLSGHYTCDISIFKKYSNKIYLLLYYTTSPNPKTLTTKPRKTPPPNKISLRNVSIEIARRIPSDQNWADAQKCISSNPPGSEQGASQTLRRFPPGAQNLVNPVNPVKKQSVKIHEIGKKLQNYLTFF